MNFSPESAVMGALGGLMIGAAAALLLLVNGRIAGVSGIAGAVTDGFLGAAGHENAAFLTGLIAAPGLAALAFGAPNMTVTQAPVLLVAGGLLVGVGTRLGSGCTSGHGVCGLSRLSPRSMAATLVFMGVAAATVAVMRTLIGGAL